MAKGKVERVISIKGPNFNAYRTKHGKVKNGGGWGGSGTCAWSKRDSAALFQSIAIMEECQALRARNLDLCDISKCLNVGIKFSCFFNTVYSTHPPPQVVTRVLTYVSSFCDAEDTGEN